MRPSSRRATIVCAHMLEAACPAITEDDHRPADMACTCTQAYLPGPARALQRLLLSPAARVGAAAALALAAVWTLHATGDAPGTPGRSHRRAPRPRPDARGGWASRSPQRMRILCYACMLREFLPV